MANNKGEEFRNVALVGHSSSGKTMLAEAMLVKGGALNRLGRSVMVQQLATLMLMKKKRRNLYIHHCSMSLARTRNQHY